MTDRNALMLAALVCFAHVIDRIPGNGGAVLLGALAAVFLVMAWREVKG